MTITAGRAIPSAESRWTPWRLALSAISPCAGVQPRPARRLLAPACNAALPGAVLGKVGGRLRARLPARQRRAAPRRDGAPGLLELSATRAAVQHRSDPVLFVQSAGCCFCAYAQQAKGRFVSISVTPSRRMASLSTRVTRLRRTAGGRAGLQGPPGEAVLRGEGAAGAGGAMGFQGPGAGHGHGAAKLQRDL